MLKCDKLLKWQIYIYVDKYRYMYLFYVYRHWFVFHKKIVYVMK